MTDIEETLAAREALRRASDELTRAHEENARLTRRLDATRDALTTAEHRRDEAVARLREWNDREAKDEAVRMTLMRETVAVAEKYMRLADHAEAVANEAMRAGLETCDDLRAIIAEVSAEVFCPLEFALSRPGLLAAHVAEIAGKLSTEKSIAHDMTTQVIRAEKERASTRERIVAMRNENRLLRDRVAGLEALAAVATPSASPPDPIALLRAVAVADSVHRAAARAYYDATGDSAFSVVDHGLFAWGLAPSESDPSRSWLLVHDGETMRHECSVHAYREAGGFAVVIERDHDAGNTAHMLRLSARDDRAATEAADAARAADEAESEAQRLAELAAARVNEEPEDDDPRLAAPFAPEAGWDADGRPVT